LLSGALKGIPRILKNHGEWPTQFLQDVGSIWREVTMKLKIKRAAYAAATLALAAVAFGAAVKFR
jgi:hypothetical protein